MSATAVNTSADGSAISAKGKSARFAAVRSVQIYEEAAETTEATMAAILESFDHAFLRDDDLPDAAAEAGGQQQQPRCQFIDVGCGPGTFTLKQLLPRLPSRCQRLVAVDNSEAMLDFAREHRADPRIEYRTLDLAAEVDVARFVREHGRFQRVYSFLAIHWTADQRSAMRNIETLMAPGGECFLVFSDNIVLFDIFKAMMTQPRWAKYSDRLKPYIPETAGMKDIRSLRSHLASIVSATNLIPLACEVFRTKAIMKLSRDISPDFFVLLNPVYPLLEEAEKAELKKFTLDFVRKHSTTGDPYKEQIMLVIHAYKSTN
ncbi:trans-aconitate 2-methyltransferase-like [Dermacentor silvarum]|uniref:trans-aconitate 2-methyltransferase-like n=1 Tax=Dermacentor silvarum TaxID=543639 RepID=UPI0021012B73|nr:trans-aconitate 2-methyltransferase-like [Dermacentor silvarum]